jgi:hypothetical protein
VIVSGSEPLQSRHRNTRGSAAVRGDMKAFILIGFAAACAGAPARPAQLSLKAPLDTLSFYVGKWQCKGTYFATPEQPTEETWDARIEVEPELDGTSLHVQMFGPGDNRSEEHKGYSATTKTWHHVAVTNSGSWIALVSPGWDGTRMVFTPAAGGDDSHERATFTKRSDREYSHAVSRATDHGEDRVWEKVCRKS